MEPQLAVFDACVLYSEFLRAFLVWLAIHGKHRHILRAKWTGRIHAEWIRAVRQKRPDIPRSNLERTRRLMDQNVGGSRVRGYLRWEQPLTLPDPDDRHVLAAALACVADVIVTFNLPDFPQDVLRPFGMTALAPDDFVIRLAAPEVVVVAAAEHRANCKRPAYSLAEYLDALSRNQMHATAALLAAEPPELW